MTEKDLDEVLKHFEDAVTVVLAGSWWLSLCWSAVRATVFSDLVVDEVEKRLIAAGVLKP